MQGKKLISITSLIILLITLFLVMISIRLIQNIRQRAASATGDVVVDFSNRSNTAHPISNHFAGMNGFDKIMSNSQILPYLSSSHFDLMRVSIDMVGTFTSSTQQNWTTFDTMMSDISSQNLQPILTIGYTPSWLQPNPNPCGTSGNSHVPPTNAQLWGQLAALVVAHMDQKYPTIHPLYEIWNEPDGTTFMCVSPSDPNPDQTRLNDYKLIYAAAAPLMKQQAQKDGTTIRIGGPALAVPKARASLWFPSLVSDPTIAPYLDFITYHDYQNGGTPGDSWATFLAGTQNATTGQAAIFEQISKYVRAGTQPNPSQTPIYEDEYNTNTGLPNSTRNDPTYAPLWNSLIIADLLNTVNDTSSPYGAAQQTVAGFAYFGATQPPPGNEFCLFGTWDSSMDCAAGNQPYPQYYAYQLFTDPKYLDITNQGYVATSATTSKPGIIVTGFYTGTNDSVVIINTGAIAYANLAFNLLNPGNTNDSTATILTLNQSNPHITSSQTSLQPSGNGYQGIVTIPAFSTVAVWINATSDGGGILSPTATSNPRLSITPQMTSNPTLSPTAIPTPFPSGTNFCGISCQSNADCDQSGVTCGICDTVQQVCISGVSPTPTISLISPSTTQSPSSALSPTTTLGPTLGSLAVHFEGVDPLNNPSPLHQQREITLYFYKTQNFNNLPDYTLQTLVSFNSADPNGSFSNSAIDLSSIPAGSYYLLVKSEEGSLREEVSPQLFAISPGQTVLFNNGSGTSTPVNLPMGDLTNANSVSIPDYNIIIDCFGVKYTTTGCTNHNASDKIIGLFADINDDGDVNGVDYNILLRNFGKNGF